MAGERREVHVIPLERPGTGQIGKQKFDLSRDDMHKDKRTVAGMPKDNDRAAVRQSGKKTEEKYLREVERMSDKRRRGRRRNRRKKVVKLGVSTILLAAVVWIGATKLPLLAEELGLWEKSQSQEQDASENQAQDTGENQVQEAAALKQQIKGQVQDYPPELAELLEKNAETLDFVQSYPSRKDFMTKDINLEQDVKSGDVPLLLQWDKRWGYNDYGKEMVGLAGCGPTCLSMIYIYLTGDTSMNPRKMSEFAYDAGFYTTEGTSWSLWTDGAAKLGLDGYEISLDEQVIKKHLDNGELVVCSMAPGDFTTTGHFIVLRGYNENGFFVNDPNSKENSDRQWDFETLRYQIKCLWTLGNEGK